MPSKNCRQVSACRGGNERAFKRLAERLYTLAPEHYSTDHLERNMPNKKRAFVVLPILLLCGLPTVWCVWSYIAMNSYNNIEQEVLPKFDSLNEKVFSELPSPEDVQLIEEYNQHYSSPKHGAYLLAEYKSLTMTPNEVVNYYRDLFQSQGWKEYRTEAMSDEYFIFYRDTACVDLSIYSSKQNQTESASNMYELMIWHDFFNQDFSPPRPLPKLMEFFEFGYTYIMQCDYR